MRYVKAETILPESLIKEIQKYIQGEYLYIPSEGTARKKWGEKSGIREHIRTRNEAIRSMHRKGYGITDLAEEFYLSMDSIKKIIYTKEVYNKLPL